MSVLVGLVSRAGAVIAADSQRVESNGSLTIPYEKTFAIGDWLIGGLVGLLEYSGMTTTSRLISALGVERQSVSSCFQRVSDCLLTTLAILDPNEVHFQYRCVEVLLATRPRKSNDARNIMTVEVRPNPDGTTFSHRENVLSSSAHTGDAAARVPIDAIVRTLGKQIDGTGLPQLKKLANRLVESGIRSSGPHPIFQNVPACGGAPSLRSLRF